VPQAKITPNFALFITVKIAEGVDELSESKGSIIIDAPAGYFRFPTACSVSKQSFLNATGVGNRGTISHFDPPPP